MSAPRCETCRFWSASTSRDVWDDEAANPGRDELGDYVETEHRKCLAVIHGNRTAVRGAARAPAMVCDGSGYAATLWTLPTFFCALYEDKSKGAAS